MKLVEKESSFKSQKKCMNCSRIIDEDEYSKDFYASKFCSDACKQEFFAGAKRNKK